jgi:uncharacterized protein (TIGR01777 family)
MSKKIIITGATGLIGKQLSKDLHVKGYELCIFTREPEKSTKVLPYATSHVKWDINHPESWSKHINGANGIINLAGASIGDKRWTDKRKQVILNSRINGTAKLVEAVLKLDNPPKVFINASAIGYYADNGDKEVDETYPAGSGFLSEVCRQWEEAAQPVSAKSRLVIGRFGIVLSKEGGALAKMLTPYKFYIGGPIGNGRQWQSWIHIQDLCGLIIWALENENISGVLNFTAPNPVRMDNFSKILGNVMHKPSFFRVPEFVLKLMMGESSEIVLKGNKILPKRVLELGYKYYFEDLQSALSDLMI